MCCPEQITSPILMQCMSPAHAVLILGDVSCQSFFPSRIARVTGMYHGHVISWINRRLHVPEFQMFAQVKRPRLQIPEASNCAAVQ